jgi:hypothetical protein
MAVPWGVIVFLVGILYGFFTPGRQDKGRLLRNGIIIGLVLALVFALLGAFAGANPLGFGGSGFVGIFVSALVLTILFVLGVWLGDLLEGRGARRTRRI